MRKFLITAIIIFIIGVTIGSIISQFYIDQTSTRIQTKTHRGFKTTTNLISPKTQQEPLNAEKKKLDRQELPSPSDWIKEKDIHVYYDKVEIDCKNCQWANFADTNSMDPVLDYGHNAIEIIPKKTTDLQVGDIASYKSPYVKGTIIHRIIKISRDEKGWYAIFKGDNNSKPDPYKVRFDQIKRKVVAIIY